MVLFSVVSVCLCVSVWTVCSYDQRSGSAATVVLFSVVSACLCVSVWTACSYDERSGSVATVVLFSVVSVCVCLCGLYAVTTSAAVA